MSSSSDVLKKEDTLDILRLMDDIRASWGLVFDCENNGFRKFFPAQATKQRKHFVL